MAFTTIENYDGMKGYLPGERGAGKILKKDGVRYFYQPYGTGEDSLEKFYRIIKENEETALAVPIKNPDLIKELREVDFPLERIARKFGMLS